MSQHTDHTGQSGAAGREQRTAARISALLRDIPPRDADPTERAAWFDRKADLFDHIAATDLGLTEEATEMADNARREARRLRRGQP